ncbi:MAG: type III-B CRISPR module RAMP protein Cmr1 [Candidatus Competibacteraceae bacterium]
MTVISATYRVVTPMFLGDANQKATGLRPPSVKGALRFWWRALNWGRCQRDASPATEALKWLYREEQRLFGTAAVVENDRPLGQGAFLLRISQPSRIATDATWPTNNTGSGYLGFGLMESGNPANNNDQPHREGIREGIEFGLELRFKPGTRSSDMDALLETLRAWNLFGGLGSRARRGFGSVTLVKMNDQEARLDRIAYEAAANAMLQTAAETTDFPPYTALSRHTRFGILTTGNEARMTHNQAGQLYKAHCSQASTLPNNLRSAAKIPFGLPLQGVDLDSRRASPLLFHIHALRDGSFAAAALYLPAEFHHERRYQPADLTAFYREVARFVPAEAHP